MLTINRKEDSRTSKCILHRVADIPGGVTISVADCGGDTILEGTPLCKTEDGLYKVLKTVRILADIAKDADNDNNFIVAKGHHFKVGDIVGINDRDDRLEILSIDKSDPEKDVIVLETGVGYAVKAGDVMALAPESDAIAIVGSNYTITPGSNIFADAWVMAVVRQSNAPCVNGDYKVTMTGIIYV